MMLMMKQKIIILQKVGELQKVSCYRKVQGVRDSPFRSLDLVKIHFKKQRKGVIKNERKNNRI